ncbi:hypothetical protein GCM10007203_09180 [Staphylococcus nepalensis]|nr:hypothetical protein GCM10007203_09180 [Staphylococcus nepalensis]
MNSSLYLIANQLYNRITTLITYIHRRILILGILLTNIIDKRMILTLQVF